VKPVATTVCVIVLSLPWLTSRSPAADQRPPNVLWICGDDHSAFVYGAYGNKLARTPNLDRLAAQGMRFDRAYCNSPVCTASRQSFLTGRYPRSVGVTRLSTPLSDGEVTLAEMLNARSYDTAAIGKMHFNSSLRHGFDVLVGEQDHAKWLADKGKRPLPTDIPVLPAWRPFKDPAAVWLNSDCRPLGLVEGDMRAAFFLDRAEQFLGRHAGAGDKPFFLMVSFTEPHSPFHFPVEYQAKRRKPEEFAVPKAGPEDDAQVPAVFRDLTDEQKRGIVAAYHTSVEYHDGNVSLLLQLLDKRGLADETLVIYTGDHGYMLGEHGRFEKHCGYEPAVRAPLVVRFPGKVKRGSSTNALVELVDIVPTVLELTGTPVPQRVQGRSLAGLLAGKANRHRERVMIEYSENAEGYVVTDRYKFIYCAGNRERDDGYATGRPLPGRTVRLYDLEKDPGELTNLASRPEHAVLVAELTASLANHMKATARRPERIPATDDVHAILNACLQPDDLLPTPSS
jgi:choline-sulfatase